jgi:hypothetical protein
MASKRRVRRRTEARPPRLPHWRADGGAKVRYRTEADANRAALQYRLEHGANLGAYACEICDGWHLGGAEIE